MNGARELGIGVVGLGGMGRIHAACLEAGVPHARLAAVADLDETVVATVVAVHSVAGYSNIADLLAHSGVDAVVVATPAETHAEIVVAAAAAGKHILCEKPLDCRLEAMDRALGEVQRAGVRLQVAFNRRFDRNFQLLREELDASRIGEVVSIHIVSRDPMLQGPPRVIGAMSGRGSPDSESRSIAGPDGEKASKSTAL